MIVETTGEPASTGAEAAMEGASREGWVEQLDQIGMVMWGNKKVTKTAIQRAKASGAPSAKKRRRGL